MISSVRDIQLGSKQASALLFLSDLYRNGALMWKLLNSRWCLYFPVPALCLASGPGPRLQFVFTGPGPQFVFTDPGPDLCLQTLAPNVCLPTLTVKNSFTGRGPYIAFPKPGPGQDSRFVFTSSGQDFTTTTATSTITITATASTTTSTISITTNDNNNNNNKRCIRGSKIRIKCPLKDI